MSEVPLIQLDKDLFESLIEDDRAIYTAPSSRIPEDLAPGRSVMFGCPLGRRFVRRIYAKEAGSDDRTSLFLENTSRRS